MKTFLVRIAAGERRLSIHTIATSSFDALMHVMGALEAQGFLACSGSVRPIGGVA